MQDTVHPEITTEIDIPDGDIADQKIMMAEYDEILQSFRGQILNKALFDAIVHKFEEQQKYYIENGFPASCCIITVYGAAIDKKNVRKVILAQKVVKNKEYNGEIA